MEVAVIGAGAMGTALALALERGGNRVAVCGTDLDARVLASIEALRNHPALEAAAIPPTIVFVGPDRWEGPVSRSDIVAVAVASAGVRTVVRSARPMIGSGAVWAIASKGWDPETAEPLSKLVADESPGQPVVVVSGPSIARELALGTPTGFVCASRDHGAARKVAGALSSPTVTTFVSDDVHGVEVGAAIKNVLAIALGMCDGVAEATGLPMTNAKAALFSRGLVEMSRLSVALGGRRETALGLAGAGDLFVTVAAGRNGRYGRLIGTGVDPTRALEEMATTVEGYENTREALELANRHRLDLSIVRAVNDVLFAGVSPQQALASLGAGAPRPEL